MVPVCKEVHKYDGCLKPSECLKQHARAPELSRRSVKRGRGGGKPPAKKQRR